MIIFLDANIIFDEHSRDTLPFKTLLRLCATQGFQLQLPHVAVLEAERLYIERIQAYNDDISKLLIVGETAQVGVGPLNQIELDTPSLRTAYHRSLMGFDKFPQPNIQILFNTAEDRSLAIERTLNGRRPSKYRGESGTARGSVNARDTLIWLSIIRFISRKTGSFVFIAKDPDFYEDQNKDHLHSYLASEVTQTAPACQFSIYKSLSAFLTTIEELTQREREVIEAQEEHDRLLNDLNISRETMKYIQDREWQIHWIIRSAGDRLHDRIRSSPPEAPPVDMASHSDMQAAHAEAARQREVLKNEFFGFSERHSALNQRYDQALERLRKAEAASTGSQD